MARNLPGRKASNVVMLPGIHFAARTPTTLSKMAHPNGLISSSDEHTPLLSRLKQNPAKGYTDSDNTAVKYSARVAAITWDVLTCNYANVLLVFVPLGIVAGLVGWDPVTVFILNFFAIVPLAGMLAFATEELAAVLGQTLGGLMNATFGNAVELIVSIIALREGQIRIVQSSMLGSILSNSLLVLGCCFIAGGIGHHRQNFTVVVAQTMASLMAVASVSLILPATLYISSASQDKETRERNALTLSRGTAIVLLILYILYLFFQLRTHADLFVDDQASGNEQQQHHPQADGDLEGQPSSSAQDQNQDHEGEEEGGHEKKEGDTLRPIPAGVTLVLVTVCVAICAEFLVDSIDAIVERAHISKTFIGLILLPIVGNAAEHVTAVVVSWKNKMNLALGVAIGSSMQIALFVTPALVLLGWMIGQPMSLRFETFETVVFFVSVLVVNYVIQDGESNYLEGCMCLGTYILIGIAFYLLPDDATSP